MKICKRAAEIAVVAASAALLFGCGSDTVAPGPTDGNEPPPDLGPFTVTEMFLRPYSVQLPPEGRGLPTPGLAEHYLTTFYQGGTQLATFDWTLPASVGTIDPKRATLTANDATVALRLRADGALPLGFFEIGAQGRSASETGAITQRFAVVQNVWMKHQRAYFRGNEPDDLILWPTFLPSAGPSDSIFYVENSSATTTRIRRIPAFSSLNGPEPIPGDTHLLPTVPENNNYDAAAKTQPDLSPAGLGRRDMLFASTMDPQYPERCTSSSCTNVPPYRLWVVQLPGENAPYSPFVLTQDSTFIRFGSTIWYAFQYRQPRWDPKATNPRARISFVSNLSGNGLFDLWTGELLDTDGNGHSDSLVNYHQLTHVGGVASYDWHPDGSRICVSGAGGLALAWVDVNTGAVTQIPIPDPSLTSVSTPTVFWRPGEHTLIAFQAQAENLSNLFVLDEQDRTLTRLLPFSMPVSTALFPRWHPTRKELVYVSDYTVEAWGNSTEGTPGRPDRLNPRTPEQFGMRRTLYPSVWVLKLE